MFTGVGKPSGDVDVLGKSGVSDGRASGDGAKTFSTENGSSTTMVMIKTQKGRFHERTE